MNQADLERMADRFQAKADKAYRNYQETGTARYDREYRNYEDLAMALRMAASANDDHAQLISLRCDVAALGARAQDLLAGELLNVAYCDARVKALLVDVAAVASAYHLIRRR